MLEISAAKSELYQGKEHLKRLSKILNEIYYTNRTLYYFVLKIT